MDRIYESFLYDFENLKDDKITDNFIETYACIPKHIYEMTISTIDNKIFLYHLFNKCYNRIIAVKLLKL